MKKAEVKSKNRYLIAVNLFLIAILVVVAVYAWFASNAVNRVDTYDVQVQADNTLELSFDGESNWSESLNLADLKNEDTTTSVLDTMKFIAVTGEGNNFYIPSLEQKQNYAAVNTSGAWKIAEENKDYLKFTVYMRSKDPIKVYLSSDSYAKPASSKVIGEGCGNPSSYTPKDGNTFSKDCIVGALRVAGFDENNSKKFVWITNPEYHLDNTVGTDEYIMRTDAESRTYVNGNGTANSEFEWNKPNEHKYYALDSSQYSLKTEANVITKLQETVLTAPASDSTLLATLNRSRDADGYFHSQAEFVVWIEGCDTEARRALIDGKFNLSLIFDSFSAEEYNQNATTPEDVMNGVGDGDEFD